MPWPVGAEVEHRSPIACRCLLEALHGVESFSSLPLFASAGLCLSVELGLYH